MLSYQSLLSTENMLIFSQITNISWISLDIKGTKPSKWPIDKLRVLSCWLILSVKWFKAGFPITTDLTN